MAAAAGDRIEYMPYSSEAVLPAVAELIARDLSEPYSVFTYRYFLCNWPQFCKLAMCDGTLVGVVIGKLAPHKHSGRSRGYVAMLAVDKAFRGKHIGRTLVSLILQGMRAEGADEVALEAEVTNTPAIRLYESLGFVRDKRLVRYYLSYSDALRLKLWFSPSPVPKSLTLT